MWICGPSASIRNLKRRSQCWHASFPLAGRKRQRTMRRGHCSQLTAVHTLSFSSFESRSHRDRSAAKMFPWCIKSRSHCTQMAMVICMTSRARCLLPWPVQEYVPERPTCSTSGAQQPSGQSNLSRDCNMTCRKFWTNSFHQAAATVMNWHGMMATVTRTCRPPCLGRHLQFRFQEANRCLGHGSRFFIWNAMFAHASVRWWLPFPESSGPAPHKPFLAIRMQRYSPVHSGSISAVRASATTPEKAVSEDTQPILTASHQLSLESQDFKKIRKD